MQGSSRDRRGGDGGDRRSRRHPGAPPAPHGVPGGSCVGVPPEVSETSVTKTVAPRGTEEGQSRSSRRRDEGRPRCPADVTLLVRTPRGDGAEGAVCLDEVHVAAHPVGLAGAVCPSGPTPVATRAG